MRAKGGARHFSVDCKHPKLGLLLKVWDDEGCCSAGSEQQELVRERQAAEAAVEEARGQKQQTKVSQRKLNQVKVGRRRMLYQCSACSASVSLGQEMHAFVIAWLGRRVA